MADYLCPKCHQSCPAPFRPCVCGFDVGHLDGTSLNSFQQKKLEKHSSLITAGSVTLAGGDYNASFTFTGAMVLPDLVRFAIGYGEPATLPSVAGRAPSEVRVAYVPWIIGEGVSLYQPGTVACSGICIVSPQSMAYGHPYPVLDAWVQLRFGNGPSTCRLCGATTVFGETVCNACYDRLGRDWRRLL
jgi:hypothetical protein